MKKVLLLFAMISCNVVLYAQDWNTIGNTIGGAAVLGTINNQSLNIITNGTQRMTLLGNTGIAGALGLGTTSPQAYLHLVHMNNQVSKFRTDGFDTGRNEWQMFTGATAGTTTRKFRIFTNTNSGLDAGTLQNTDNAIVEASVRI